MHGVNAPGPRRHPLTFLQFRRDPLGYLQGLQRQYGDFVGFGFWQSLFLVAHPEHIREVLSTQSGSFAKGRALEKAKRLIGNGLLTSEGEFHHRQRRLVLPAFHPQRIAGYGNVMVEHAARTSKRWRDGEVFDMSHEMTRLTLGIVAETLFGSNVEEEATEIGEAMTSVLLMFNRLLYPFSEIIEALPLPMVKRYKKMRQVLDSAILGIIEERRKSGVDRGDLLSMLLLAQHDDSSSGMTDAQVRDEVMTLFLAGHETTANALTWTWHLLSMHPDAEAKLHAELDQVLGGREPTMKDVAELRYTRMVVSESLRLFPPAWAIGRRSLTDQTIAGYFVPANSIVLLSSWITQRDPRFFPSPEKFDPDRWSGDRPQPQPYAYFPFGGGPRRCIGEEFAWAEAILALAVLASRWRASGVPGRSVTAQALLTLRPKHGMWMKIHRR